MARFLFLLLFFSPLFGEKLSSLLTKSAKGDYIVAEKNKQTSVIAVRSISPKTVVLEEISIPSQMAPSSIRDWVAIKAPGHTSWSMIEIDLASGKVLECYSFSQRAWLDIRQKGHFFSTLLHLDIKPLLEADRKKIGPPLADEVDLRPVWHPSFAFEGKKVAKANTIAYLSTWPEDGSELSSSLVTLYFDFSQKIYLPVCIQFDTSYVAGQIRTLEVGKGLKSPHTKIPRRIPEFLGGNKRTDEGGLLLTLKAPPYFESFSLYAVDLSGGEKKILPIAHKERRGSSDLTFLEISADQLRETLEPYHEYRWLIVPEGYSDCFTESQKTFFFSDSSSLK